MIIISWIVFSLIIGAIGSSRKIGFLAAFFISLVLSPVLGLIITLVSKDKQTDKVEQALLQQQKSQTKISVNEAGEQLADLEKLKTNKLISEAEYQKLRTRIQERIA